jgi:hypothetical protein
MEKGDDQKRDQILEQISATKKEYVRIFIETWWKTDIVDQIVGHSIKSPVIVIIQRKKGLKGKNGRRRTKVCREFKGFLVKFMNQPASAVTGTLECK